MEKLMTSMEHQKHMKDNFSYQLSQFISSLFNNFTFSHLIKNLELNDIKKTFT